VLRLASWILALTAAAGADDYSLFKRTPKDKARAFVTDRPGNTDSPQTVPAGWFQIEADLASYLEDSDGPIRTRTLEIGTTNFGLKAGLTLNTDLHLIWAPYVRQEMFDRTTGVKTTAEGSGNLTVRVKWNLWGNDGGETALALLPFVTFPTESSELNSRGAGVGIAAPFGMDLGSGWWFNAELTAEYFDSRAASGADEFFFKGSAKATRVLDERWTTWAEVFASVPTRSNAYATVDVGIVYLAGENVALDLTVFFGVNGDAPDFKVALGVSYRF